MSFDGTQVVAQGSCACAAVTFTAALPSLWVAHCHCTQCQRSSGAAFMTWAGFEENRCKIQDPKHALHWYASSDKAKRGFCSRCGSALFFSSQRWPNELHITLSNIITPLDKAPEMHVFWENACQLDITGR